MNFFGTDGIRGHSDNFPFDNYTLQVIGKSIAETLKGKSKNILIIRDTRQSGKRIEKNLAIGISGLGKKIIFGGVMPTPAAAFILKKEKYLAAIVISASHNPYKDNGIKIFASNGYKLSDLIEEKIEKKIEKYLKTKPSFNTKISIKENKNLIKKYENFVIKTFKNKKIKDKNIVLDCANGASYKCASEIFKKLGAKVIAVNTKPDGKNINLDCGALHPQNASKVVKKNKAFLGFAFDGDADRVICIDENGIVRDGDFYLGAMAKYLKSLNKLKNNTLVTTVMANIGLKKYMAENDIKVISSKVGDRYVIEDMKKYNACFGGEQSGHFIFKDLLTTGDGILSAVQLLDALTFTNQTLSEFVSGMEKFPQVLINRKVDKKVPFEKLPKSLKLIKQFENELGDNGRVLVRYSGTENLLRVMIEGKDTKKINEMALEMADNIEKEIMDI